MMLFLKTKDIKPLDLQIRCKKMKEENKWTNVGNENQVQEK